MQAEPDEIVSGGFKAIFTYIDLLAWFDLGMDGCVDVVANSAEF